MMTQRAKLRRLAFIDLPSWSRGSRPFILRTYPWVATRKSHGRPYCNLGAARLAAKGTTSDYLTHPNPIPAQKMALERGFFAKAVKTAGGHCRSLRQPLTVAGPLSRARCGAAARA